MLFNTIHRNAKLSKFTNIVILKTTLELITFFLQLQVMGNVMIDRRQPTGQTGDRGPTPEQAYDVRIKPKKVMKSLIH